MKKSLFATLTGVAVLAGTLLLIVKKGALAGLLVVLFLAALLFGVSALTGIFHGKKVQGRDRHP